jgi:hypothetical protein
MVARTLQFEVQDLLKICLVCPGGVQTAFFRNMISGFHDTGVSEMGSFHRSKWLKRIFWCWIYQTRPSCLRSPSLQKSNPVVAEHAHIEVFL